MEWKQIFEYEGERRRQMVDEIKKTHFWIKASSDLNNPGDVLSQC